jgi:hypothetical protein
MNKCRVEAAAVSKRASQINTNTSNIWYNTPKGTQHTGPGLRAEEFARLQYAWQLLHDTKHHKHVHVIHFTSKIGCCCRSLLLPPQSAAAAAAAAQLLRLRHFIT